MFSTKKAVLSRPAHIYRFFSPSGQFLLSSAGVVNFESRTAIILNDIVLPPIGYAATFDTGAAGDRLFGIAFFANYACKEWMLPNL